MFRAGPRLAFARAEMEIPAPLPDRRAARRRKARAREPRDEKRREADTTLPVSRWNLISAPLFRVSCRQKTAEQNYYNWFSRIETVPSWFRCSGWEFLVQRRGLPRLALRRRRGKRRAYPNDSAFAIVSSFSRIMAPSCQTLPATSVKTMSPG